MAKLAIYNREDRLTVAKILIDNGYTVKQGKRKLTPNGKSVEYYLDVEKEAEATSSEERS
jgi:pyruvate carboxylase